MFGDCKPLAGPSVGARRSSFPVRNWFDRARVIRPRRGGPAFAFHSPSRPFHYPNPRRKCFGCTRSPYFLFPFPQKGHLVLPRGLREAASSGLFPPPPAGLIQFSPYFILCRALVPIKSPSSLPRSTPYCSFEIPPRCNLSQMFLESDRLRACLRSAGNPFTFQWFVSRVRLSISCPLAVRSSLSWFGP